MWTFGGDAVVLNDYVLTTTKTMMVQEITMMSFHISYNLYCCVHDVVQSAVFVITLADVD